MKRNLILDGWLALVLGAAVTLAANAAPASSQQDQPQEGLTRTALASRSKRISTARGSRSRRTGIEPGSKGWRTGIARASKWRRTATAPSSSEKSREGGVGCGWHAGH